MILILGNGYIGQAFAQYLQSPWTLISRRECDYTDAKQARLMMSRGDVVINCAGFTGRPNIDECEVKRRETVLANIALPAMLSRAAEECGRVLVHISSGCIYEGDNGGAGWREEDEPTPHSFYSKSKVMGEYPVNGYVMRIRMPFGRAPHPRSFITKIRGYRDLISAQNSMTYIEDMVRCVEALITKAPRGIYHVTNSGSASHRDIVEAFDIADWQPNFIALSELQTAAPRSNCILNNEKASRYYEMPPIMERIMEVARVQR